MPRKRKAAPEPPVPKLEDGQAFYCDDEATILDEGDLVRIYECNNCGGEANEDRQCESCKKFKARREEDGCPNCFKEPIIVDVVEDHDGTLILAEDFDPDGEAYAVRSVEIKAAQKAEQDARINARVEKLKARAELKTWADVQPGDHLLAKGNTGEEFDTLRTTHVAAMWIAPQDVEPDEFGDDTIKKGMIVSVQNHFGTTIRTHLPTDPAWIVKDEPRSPLPAPEERLLVIDTDEGMGGSSVGVTWIEYGMTSPRNGHRVPLCSLRAGRASYSNMVHGVADFIHPAEARSFAAVLQEAARNLRARGVEDTPSEEDDGRFTLDSQTHRWGEIVPSLYAWLKLGVMDWPEPHPVCEVRTSGENDRERGITKSVTVENPLLLDAMVEATLEIATYLEEKTGLK